MSQPPTVAIVTDGMWRKSLSAIRSLGKAGYQVHVLGDSHLTLGFWSRFSARRVLAPDAKEDLAGFGTALKRHLYELRSASPNSPRPVLLPMEDATLRYVVDNAGGLSDLAAFVIPDAKALSVASDKSATMDLAEQLDVPHPSTTSVASGDELLRAVEHMRGAELIVKPTDGSGSRGVRYNPSFTPDEATSYVREFGSAVVQRRIPAGGDALGVSVLIADDGTRLAHFCHKRLREFPNSGGPSTDRIGITNDHLLEASLRLLEAINWRGVAMVEWKAAPQGGEPQLIEINPRFWGSLELAVRSGVDFPTLYARAAARASDPSATGPRPGRAPEAGRPGVRCRWLVPGDTLRWLTSGRKSRESLALFCRGLPSSAEEWDGQDLRGSLACVVCQGLAVLTPKYRKMLKR